MSYVARRSVRLATLALTAAIAAAVLFYPTDEKRVRQAADALIDAANGSPAALALALDTHASSNVRLDVSELPEAIVGREAIVEAVARARELEPNLRLHADGTEVLVEGRRARVSADLITTLRPEVPELRRPRHLSALFEERGGQFRLLSVEVGAPRLDQPEARP
jgi:hypothetical protein